MTELFNRVSAHGRRTAIIDDSGVYSYTRIFEMSGQIASALLEGGADLKERRIAFMVGACHAYPSVMFGIWLAGGIAVPLCVTHPEPEIEHVLDDSGAAVIITDDVHFPLLENISVRGGQKLVRVSDALKTGLRDLPHIGLDRRAMIIYTSGTTSRPKGVVSAHGTIQAQILSLVKAWEWSADDYILNVLPLHHLHGILNVLLCALWSGARCEMLPRFDAGLVWEKFMSRDLSLFMAVPTIYTRLIRYWEDCSDDMRETMSRACSGFRLMVSGSAALPARVLDRWKEISGHTLLERYGMTEIGMALSNPLHGERLPGHVGLPMPGVSVALADENYRIHEGRGPGEIVVKGDNVFVEYWRNNDATNGSFTSDGWFKTGDMAERNDKGYYRILGRSSVDIIKSGGYKISALEIEAVLRAHPDIEDCAVVGVSDAEWGESVSAALILKPGSASGPDEFRVWCKDRLAPYKVPSRFLIADSLPRNAMGKVIKPELIQMFT